MPITSYLWWNTECVLLPNMRKGRTLLKLLFSFILGVLASSIKQEIKNIQTAKEEIKQPIFADDTICRKSQRIYKKTSRTKTESSKVVRYKVDI